MGKIFLKAFFSLAPGGDRYEWKESETVFKVASPGIFAIKIQASAKNAQQNGGTDDDDLRVALDDFSFGKYQQHEEMLSWKGFGTSSSWDGASLKGGTKTIYFFMELNAGEHKLRFFADKTPALKSIEVFEIENDEFELKSIKPDEKIESEKKGIPWMSFIFLGLLTKEVSLDVKTQSSAHKRGTDGDNLKIVINGEVFQNQMGHASYKYKNFYFSGDIKEFDTLSISHEVLSHPLAFENTIELWYDEEPEIINFKVEFWDAENFLESFSEWIDLKKYIVDRAHGAISYFSRKGDTYSAKFLEHALQSNPESLIFKANHPIVQKIKTEPAYLQLLKKVKEKILGGQNEGEIWPNEIQGEIIFNSPDLRTSLHGIRKVEYKTEPNGKKRLQVKLVLFDVYDFEKVKLPRFIKHPIDYIKKSTNNALDAGEKIGVIQNYEVQIHITDSL